MEQLMEDNLDRSVKSFRLRYDGFLNPFFNFLAYKLHIRYAYDVWLQASRLLNGELVLVIYVLTDVVSFCL